MNEYRKHKRMRRLVAPLIILLILLGAFAGFLVGKYLGRYPEGRSSLLVATVTSTADTVEQPVTAPPATTIATAVTTADAASTPTRLLAATAVAAPTANTAPPTAVPTVIIASAPTATQPAAEAPAPTSTRLAEEAPAPTAVPIAAAADATINTLGAAFDPNGQIGVPLVFVVRRITDHGTVYWMDAKGMPGVGPFSRFEVAAPGRLVLLEADGAPRILIDGANPTAASLQLIDVSAPNVSYDGQTILFAGLPAGDYEPGYMTDPGAWRIYAIGVDGSGLRQLTFSDQDDLDLSQFGALAPVFEKYDDTDPVWLPDGRIVFSSTRWPAFGQYGGARTTNLFVMNADGSNLHRITSERNGADRPLIDPLTGQIVYARWWRNFRVPLNDMQTVAATSIDGFRQKDGLLAVTDVTETDPVPGGSPNVVRNAWHLGVINPDGTGLKLFTGGSQIFLLGEDASHAYGGAFAPDGTLYANYYPIRNMTEASGFGGIRRYQRGPSTYESIVGVTADSQYPIVSEKPDAFGVMQSAYASDPAVLPDGRIVFSWAADWQQDYGIYVANRDGSNRQRLFDVPGFTELRAEVVAPRPAPPIIADRVTAIANPLPPLGEAPRASDGTFVFSDLNVYFNAPVDSEIISAVPVGQAGTVRFYMEHQRLQPGSLDWVDWPILLQELAVTPQGAVTAQAPANVPLFEQLRSPQPAYQVPLTGRGSPDTPGVAQVLGHNFGRPGEVMTCVGCHAGHSMIEVPADPAEAQWTNLAPGATVSASSTHPLSGGKLEGVVDRRVQKGRVIDYWRSDPAQGANGQWVQLTFPVPVTVRTVRLYNPRPESAAAVALQVTGATVRLYSDPEATVEVAQASARDLAVTGTDVNFTPVLVRSVRVVVEGVTGTFENETVASLAEVEVIARAEAADGALLAQSGSSQ
jgi:Tol biopolymer transport system component